MSSPRLDLTKLGSENYALTQAGFRPRFAGEGKHASQSRWPNQRLERTGLGSVHRPGPEACRMVAAAQPLSV